MHLWVGYSFHHVFREISFQESRHRADVDTLTTSNAHTVSEWPVVGRADKGFETTVDITKRRDTLHFGAYANASAAQYALVGIPNHRNKAEIFLVVLLFALEGPFASAGDIRQILQFAVAIPLTRLTIHRMVG